MIFILDNLATDYTKPSAQTAKEKMWMLLCMEDSSLDVAKWGFYTNTPLDIPQQDNAHDCGVFVCLYARCLSLKYSLPHCLLSIRKQMITELHKQMIDGPFLPEVQTEQYYAVDYINRYYIGRVLSIHCRWFLLSNTFLHYGSKIYSWPKHDDTDTVHKSCIFMGLLPCLAQVLSLFLSKEN